MKFEEIVNKSDREFKSLESEAWRSYTYPDGDILDVENPIALSISGSGHYVIDSSGVVNFFPNGFIRLRWKNKADKANVNF